MKTYLIGMMIFAYSLMIIPLKAQQAGLILIHQEKPKKQRLLKKGKVIKINHFSNGQLLQTRGTLVGKMGDFIRIHPNKVIQVNPKDKGVSNEMFRNTQISINSIQYLSPKRSTGQEFISMIGYLVTIYSSGLFIGGLVKPPSTEWRPFLFTQNPTF